MSWITVRYHPGFAHDLTSWTTTIERNGKLVQRVEVWPDGLMVEHRASLSRQHTEKLEWLIAAVDFDALSDSKQLRTVVDDVGLISVAVKSEASKLEFAAPLTYWDWARERGQHDSLPNLDFDPALRLWRAIDDCSPHSLRPRAT